MTCIETIALDVVHARSTDILAILAGSSDVMGTARGLVANIATAISNETGEPTTETGPVVQRMITALILAYAETRGMTDLVDAYHAEAA